MLNKISYAALYKLIILKIIDIYIYSECNIDALHELKGQSGYARMQSRFGQKWL